MKILEVATEAPPYKGGISRLVGLLSNGFKLRGHLVHILTPNIRFREFKLSNIPFRRHNDYDVIHLHGPTPFLSDLMFMTNCKSPIVYTHHAEICWLSEKLSKIYRGFHRFLAKRARAIIVHSYDYACLLKGANVVVIRMPCPFKHPDNFDIEEKTKPFTVLYVGQFRPFKGIAVLIKAAMMLKDVNFILAGDGYLKPKFMHMARGLKNVRFCAVSDEKLKELYKQAHVICLPSINTTEAYGLVLIEGALYGCVPLASDLIGVRENISQLRGLQFKTGSYKSLAERIRLLANNRDLFITLATRSQKAAANYVNTYNSDYYVEKHLEVFSRCHR